ncbi:hypothetical protein D0T50_12840 [Bacteroides sp. 214]|uniref:hypothetical protein n=1 Tax=Bacteroides sp. 214 TaxID=2302935 RepID=UPI0013CF5264|nr:hypothetical protein [Bacteroides sp. 214]NDW13767.1 hypothetical protein [Bacteroides sp. 214]
MASIKYPYLIITISLLCALLFSCSEEGEELPPLPVTCLQNDNIIISEIVGLPQDITFSKVKAEISGVDWQIIATVEGKYSNGKVTLSLPVHFSNEELQKATRADAADYTGYWPAEGNNAQAKVAALNDIIAYDNDNNRIGRLFLSDWSGEGSKSNKTFIYYHYANQDFALSGYNFTLVAGGRKSFSYNASFKTGWNAYANTSLSSGITHCTTFIEEEMPLTWHFESWL